MSEALTYPATLQDAVHQLLALSDILALSDTDTTVIQRSLQKVLILI